MHKKSLSLLLASIVIVGLAWLPQQARADTGVTIGVEAWHGRIWGDINKPKLIGVTLKDALNMDEHWNPRFIVQFDTSGWWPDIRLEYGTMMSDGVAHFDEPICFLGYTIKGRVDSQVAIKEGRILFAWHPIDTAVVDFQTGLDLRWVSLNIPVSAQVTVEGCTPSTASGPISGKTYYGHISTGQVAWLPAINLGVTVHLPARFDLFFKGSGLPYASNYIFAFRTGFKYHFTDALSIQVGYRRWRLHLEDTSMAVNGSIDFKGPYAGLYWHF